MKWIHDKAPGWWVVVTTCFSILAMWLSFAIPIMFYMVYENGHFDYSLIPWWVNPLFNFGAILISVLFIYGWLDWAVSFGSPWLWRRVKGIGRSW